MDSGSAPSVRPGMTGFVARPCLTQPEPIDQPPERARSSAEEHLLDMEGVTGSIPVAPTILLRGLRASQDLRIRSTRSRMPAEALAKASRVHGLHHHQNRPARSGGAADAVAPGACQRAQRGDARRDQRRARRARTRRRRARVDRDRGRGGLLLRLRSQGADGAPPRGRRAMARDLAKDFDTIMRFWHFPRPTIAAVRGPCLAGACELALACDITIAADDAFFGEPELKFGAGIVAMLLPWVVGPKIAKEIIYTGEDRISAARAREIGMVNRVVPAAELEATAFSIAEHIAAVDPQLVKETKRAINRAFEAQNMLSALEEALAIDLAIEGAGSPDKVQFMEIARRDGLKAALAWRDARFPARKPQAT